MTLWYLLKMVFKRGMLLLLVKVVSPQGKRSPHYQDQLSLYNQFGKKPLWLDKQELAPHIESTETLTVYQ